MKCSEIKIMTVRECADSYTVRTPGEIYRAWMKEVTTSSWYQPDKEMFVVFLLSARNHLKGFNLVTMGLVDSSLVHPREVFRAAIIQTASGIVLAHNHPSGDTSPSAEDIRITRQLIQAGGVVDIKIMDHLIIGDPLPDRPENFVSMREQGLVSFVDGPKLV